MTAVSAAVSAPASLTVAELQRAIITVRSRPAAVTEAALAGRDAVAVVVGAHPGAGASTVALAVAEAEASNHASTQVVLAESASAFESGLSAAIEADLGESGDGWRLGRRSHLLIACRVTSTGEPWSFDADAQRVVVDVGTEFDAVPRNCPLILVCRPTVPSLRRAERAVAMLPGKPVLAAVGPARWPKLASACTGTRVSALRAAGRVVHVAIDKHLVVTGLTTQPLPKSLLAAGRSLLQMLATNPLEEA